MTERTTQQILDGRASDPETAEDFSALVEAIEAEYADPDSDLNVLEELIGRACDCLPSLTDAQFSHLADCMLRAMWLGKGEDLDLIRSHEQRRPELRIVK